MYDFPQFTAAIHYLLFSITIKMGWLWTEWTGKEAAMAYFNVPTTAELSETDKK
jgi:hypothetical protein